MQNDKIVQLTARKNQLIAEATTALDGGNETRYRTLVKEIDDTQATLDSLAQIAALRGNQGAAQQVTENRSEAVALSLEQRRNAAYLGYFTGQTFERRDLTTASDGSGEAVVQQDWQPQWTAALKQFGPLASLCRLIVKTNGTPTKIPYADATGQVMTYLPDVGAVESLEADPSVNSDVRSTDTLVSFTKASIQLYQDAQIEGGLEGFIKDNLFGIAARALEAAILSGTDGAGTALPSNAGYLSKVTDGATAASVGTVVFGDLHSLYSSIDAAYRNAPNAAFYASQTTHDAIAGILDTNNRPIFKFGRDGLLRVFGKPVYVAGTASGMPSIGTASKPVVLFGDYRSAIAAVQRPLQTRVLLQRFLPDSMSIGFVSWQRVGSNAGISDAVKALVTPAA